MQKTDKLVIITVVSVVLFWLSCGFGIAIGISLFLVMAVIFLILTLYSLKP